MLLSTNLQTSRKGIYAIGGSISPSYMEIRPDETIKERKHPFSVQDLGGVRIIF